MKRRSFVKAFGVIGLGAVLAPSLSSFSKKKKCKLTILHTNDTHSNIDPFPDNHPKFPGQGGASKRASLINQIRSSEEQVLLLDAGDIFQGTPYFNKFKGELEMKLMTQMGYDVATLGNHDFDIGIDGYLNAKKHGSFQVVNSNYDFGTTEMSSLVKKNVILKKGKIKVGIFGVGIDLKGLVPEKNTVGISYLDPVKAANEQVEILKKKKCDLIICLSHLGYDFPTDPAKISDLKLAKETAGIDLIIGGHTHTFLDQVTEVQNSKNEKVYINQVGYGGLQLGRIDFDFSENKSKELSKTEVIQVNNKV
jgi:5'-nucleotidase